MNRAAWIEQRGKIDPWDLWWFDQMYERSQRPYDGQPHTDAGIRGRTPVHGLTMRDVADCIDRAFFLSSGVPSEQWPNSVYDLDLSQMDPIAIRQNAMCNVEKMMGIYPNVPGLEKMT